MLRQRHHGFDIHPKLLGSGANSGGIAIDDGVNTGSADAMAMFEKFVGVEGLPNRKVGGSGDPDHEVRRWRKNVMVSRAEPRQQAERSRRAHAMLCVASRIFPMRNGLK